MRFFYLVISFFSFLHATIHPISFSIPEEKIVSFIPQKEWDFAPLIPGDYSTYIYKDEATYRKDYQRSYYAYTKIKGGADCMRHYDILASGCIPYFEDLQNVHPMTMTHFPKELVWEAMHLPGVSPGMIDHSIFDKQRYFEILEKLLKYTREHLTCRKMAQYLLEKIGNPDPKRVLFLSSCQTQDYLRDSLYIGFRQLLGEKCDFFSKIDVLYQDCKIPDEKLKFSTIKILSPRVEISKKQMIKNIDQGLYDVIIVGSIHRINLFLFKRLARRDVRYICVCGEDFHNCCFKQEACLFVREYTSVLH